MGRELFVAWQEADVSGRVEVVLTAEHVDELLSLLVERGVKAWSSGTPVRAVGDLVETVIVAAGDPATWIAIAAALKLFFDRHKGKRLTVDGVAAVENMSVRDIEKIVRMLAEHDALRRDETPATRENAEESASAEDQRDEHDQ